MAATEFGKGLIPRDYSTHPSGYAAAAQSPTDAMLVPEDEWEERLKEQKANRASLLDLRKAYYSVLKSLDQTHYGLCWAFSTTKAIMYLMAIMNSPKVRLSAWWVAGKIKGWRDQGGWGSESLDFIAANGVPEESFCPYYRSKFDTPETRTNAALHKAIEWWDGSEDRDRNRSIMISAFLLGLPPVLDLNWLGHSMCGCNLESINPLIVNADNSWNEINDFGPDGLYRLTGNKAIPDGIVVPRVSLPSLV